jgi:hypothetical protein
VSKVKLEAQTNDIHVRLNRAALIPAEEVGFYHHMCAGWNLYASRIAVLTPRAIAGIVNDFSVRVWRKHKMADGEISLQL